MGVKLGLTLGEGHRLRVFENRVLRRIFGPKMEDVAGGWKRQHNEELHNLYISSNIIQVIKSRRMRRAGHVECMGEICIKILIGKPEGKKSLARLWCRWEDNITMDLREIG
jgi:hypothetical protein